METTKSPVTPATSAENSAPARTWERWFQGPLSSRLVRLAIFVSFLCAIFLGPLLELYKLARKTELNSHIVLIPFICGYLIWIRRDELPTRWTPAWSLCLKTLIAGLALLGMDWLLLQNGWEPEGSDHLSVLILAFYGLLVSGCFAFLGRELTMSLIFPIGMLAFIVPLPGLWVHGLEVFLQYASAEATDILFQLSGTAMYRQGLIFALPGLTLEVAPECSGIRSSLILLITSLLAAHLYLRTPWKKGFLIFMTLPIGIIRNAVRIVSLGLLTIHVDPTIMKSSLHTEGGPLFFAFSLIPLFALLILLRRSEKPKQDKPLTDN